MDAPYVPGFALEVDCLVVLWVVVAVLWVRLARLDALPPGGRAVAAWWGLAWMVDAWAAVVPWFSPDRFGWTAWIHGSLELGAVVMAAVAFGASIRSRWRAREIWVGAGVASLVALALAVAWIERTSARLEVFAVALLLGRMAAARAGAGGLPPRLVATGGAIVALTGYLIRGSWAGALWPGFLDGGGPAARIDFIAIVLLVVGGAFWLLGESRWSRGLPPARMIAFTTSLAAACLLAIGIGEWFLREHVSKEAQERLSWVVADFRSDAVTGLHAGTIERGSEEHRGVWEKLERLGTTASLDGYAYIMGLRDRRWSFLADGSISWEEERAEADTFFREESAIDGWQLPGDRTAFLPPFQDAWGVFVTASAPIWDGGEEGRILLCMDYDALAWSYSLMAMRLPSLVLLAAALACGSLWLRVQQRRAEAQAASAAVASVSHELRTPLQSVLGHAELLAQSPLNAEQRVWLEHLRSEGGQLSHLIRQMLDLSAIRSGVFALRRDPHSPRELAGSAVALVSLAARQKALALEIDAAPGLPAFVATDGVRVRQVLVNLLTNAVRYTERGSIRLQVRHEATDTLVFAVEDTGVGMSAAEQARLFQPFVRGEMALSQCRDSIGLGLAITAEIVRRLGGTIDVRSSPGAGSRFTVRVPATEACAPPPIAEDRITPILANGTLLLVEDQPSLAEFLTGWTHLLGGRPVVARTIEEAQSWLRAHGAPAVLIADRSLGKDNGFSLFRDPCVEESGEVWRIAISADDGADTCEGAARAGADVFLAKPFKLAELARAIQQCPWLDLWRDATGTAPDAAAVADAGGVGLSGCVRRDRTWCGTDTLRLAWHAEMAAALDELQTDVAARRDDAVRSLAHKLRGGALFLGIDHAGIAAALAELEHTATTGIGTESAMRAVTREWERLPLQVEPGPARRERERDE